MGSSETDGFPNANSFPGVDTSGIQSMIKTRFWQLNWLVHQTSNRRSYKWNELRSVRTPFLDGWTYKTKAVEVTATDEEMLPFRKHLMYSVYLELAALGFGNEAKRIISSFVNPTQPPLVK